jgi:hypothetical protein
MTSDDLPHQVPPALWSWARLETVESAEGGLPPSVRSQLKEIDSAMLELESAVATLKPLSTAQTDSMQVDTAPDTARTDSMQVDEAPVQQLVKTEADAELCEPCEPPQDGVGAVVSAQMDSRRYMFRIDDITHEQVGSIEHTTAC